MDEKEYQDHLSRISTLWTVVFQAHRGSEQGVVQAQQKLLERYGGAIGRYLLAALKDPHAADELAQEFALNFLRGAFKGADPNRGRFRDYVKTSLFNLIRKHYRQQNRDPMALNSELVEPAANPDSIEADQKFIQGWRDELLARTWEALAQVQAQTGQLYHTMLDYRTKHSEASSADMAETLGPQLGKSLTAAGVRQTIHRAREKFADLLLDEVAHSLNTREKEAIEQELIDLGLLSYCQDALARWSAGK